MSDDSASDELTYAMLKARQAFSDAVAAWCAHPTHKREPRAWDDPEGPPPNLSVGLRGTRPFSTPTLRFKRTPGGPWEEIG